MDEFNPKNTFRGLPLTADQEREVEHYIRTRQRNNLEWDTRELRAMIADMLHPPQLGGDDEAGLDDSMASEKSVAMHEESDRVDQLQCERGRNRE
jgi:hypothetical protein